MENDRRKVVKVCLIAPPSPWATEPAMNPPLGLCYISAYIKERVPDIEVVGIDFAIDYIDYDGNYLKRIPLDCNVYGVTGFSAQHKWMREISYYLQDQGASPLVFGGGAHASACPSEVAGIGLIPIQGDGEIPFARLLGAERAWYNDLDELPIPDRELFGMKNYHRTLLGEDAFHIVTLRGCPYSCHFCHKSSVGTKVRFRSIENVMNEIDYLIDRYGTRAFVIYDDIFTLNRNRCFEFCKQFKMRNLIWRAWSRADLIDEELLEAMIDGGLQSITFGIESGSNKILRNINKRTTREKNQKALVMCKKMGIPVRCSLMFGNPGENWATINETIDLIKETQPDEWNLAVLAPVPGSEFWEHPEKHGLKFDKKWVRDNDYLVTNRFQESGVGSIWIEHEGKSKGELALMLEYFIESLEFVCPRKNIQDTIQEIDISKIKEGI